MIALVLFWLAAFGFAFVVGHSRISLVMRELLAGIPAGPSEKSLDIATGKPVELPAIPPLIPHAGPVLAALLECPGCLGWWLGFVAGVLCPALARDVAPVFFPGDHSAPLIAAIVLSFATSAVNLLLSKVVGLV